MSQQESNDRQPDSAEQFPPLSLPSLPWCEPSAAVPYTAVPHTARTQDPEIVYHPKVLNGGVVRAWFRFLPERVVHCTACTVCGAREEGVMLQDWECESMPLAEDFGGDYHAAALEWPFVGELVSRFSIAHAHCSCPEEKLPSACRESVWGVPSSVQSARTRYWVDEVLDRTVGPKSNPLSGGFVAARASLLDGSFETRIWNVPQPGHGSHGPEEVRGEWHREVYEWASDLTARLVAIVVVGRPRETTASSGPGFEPPTATLVTETCAYRASLAPRVRISRENARYEHAELEWEPVGASDPAIDGLIETSSVDDFLSGPPPAQTA